VCGEVTGTSTTDFIPPGKIQTPSGLTLANNKLYVGDYATGHLHIYDLTGREIEDRDTGLGASALGGIAIGPDSHVYFLDMKGSRLLSWPR
jgi:outer membrane protein assembly factor BamB